MEKLGGYDEHKTSPHERGNCRFKYPTLCQSDANNGNVFKNCKHGNCKVLETRKEVKRMKPGINLLLPVYIIAVRRMETGNHVRASALLSVL